MDLLSAERDKGGRHGIDFEIPGFELSSETLIEVGILSGQQGPRGSGWKNYNLVT